MTVVEARCPANPSRLLLRVLRDGPAVTADGNLIEACCDHCSRVRRREDGPGVRRVLHRFNVAGDLIETEVVRA